MLLKLATQKILIMFPISINLINNKKIQLIISHIIQIQKQPSSPTSMHIPSYNHTLPLLILTLLLFLHPSQCAFKQITNTCLCDISDACDQQCCCDPECSQDIISKLTLYNKCNDDGFGIPMCDNITLVDVNIDDLYSGLKTIYMVMRRLFCVQRINIIDPTSFYNRTSSQSAQNYSINKLNTLRNSLNLQPTSISSLNKKTIAGIFYRSEVGTCIATNSISANIGTNGLQQCRAFMADSTNIANNQYLSIGKLTANLNINIKIYNMSQSSIYNPTSITTSNPVTSCTSGSCVNVVKYVKLYIHPTSYAVDTAKSYIIVGNLDNIKNNTYTMIKYQYTYLNSDGSIGSVSHIGYKIGSPLQLIKIGQSISSTSFNYYKINNPINLAYRRPGGACRLQSSDASDQSLIQLRLGRNQYHTCIGSSSLILANIIRSFDYIGRMGSSNNILNDYVQISWNSNIAGTDSNNVILKILYIKIGAKENPQYYVVKATVTLQPNTMEDKTLFIEYQEIENTAEMYIPPPPKVEAYLPNDFLYPFYVAQ